MKQSVKVAPPNSLILVMDYSFGVLPDNMGGALVASTSSCVAVGTLSDADGDTVITLTDELLGLNSEGLIFDGVLEAPSRELSICNVRNEKLMAVALSGAEVRIRIFANDASEPDQIAVLVGA